MPKRTCVCHQRTTAEVLGSNENNIGRAGCEILATFLKDPNSNLDHLNLGGNNLDDSCCLFFFSLCCFLWWQNADSFEESVPYWGFTHVPRVTQYI